MYMFEVFLPWWEEPMTWGKWLHELQNTCLIGMEMKKDCRKQETDELGAGTKRDIVRFGVWC